MTKNQNVWWLSAFNFAGARGLKACARVNAKKCLVLGGIKVWRKCTYDGYCKASSIIDIRDQGFSTRWKSEAWQKAEKSLYISI